MTDSGPLADRLGRVHTDLRVSVTDRCNIRCRYCAVAERVRFLPHAEVLSFEEIERFVWVAAGLGIRKVRITGGEPLVRHDVVRLVAMLAAVAGLDDLAMTTNATLLDRFAADLRQAGLKRLNISLDTLSRDKFYEISRRDAFPKVLAGIDAALAAGFARIKLNTLAIRGQTEAELVPLARYARRHDLELRFIEYMPTGGEDTWEPDRVLSGEEILALLAREVGPLEPLSAGEPDAPARLYRFRDGPGTVGLITTVSHPFCGRCNRLRLTADGQIRNCLFARDSLDVRRLLRGGGTAEDLARLIREAVWAKKARHGTDDGELVQTDRSMHQIGG